MPRPSLRKRRNGEDGEIFRYMVVNIADVDTPAENTIVLEILPGGLCAPGKLSAQFYEDGQFRSIEWPNAHKTCPVAIILLVCENELRFIWGPDVDLVEHECDSDDDCVVLRGFGPDDEDAARKRAQSRLDEYRSRLGARGEGIVGLTEIFYEFFEQALNFLRNTVREEVVHLQLRLVKKLDDSFCHETVFLARKYGFRSCTIVTRPPDPTRTAAYQAQTLDGQCARAHNGDNEITTIVGDVTGIVAEQAASSPVGITELVSAPRQTMQTARSATWRKRKAGDAFGSEGVRRGSEDGDAAGVAPDLHTVPDDASVVNSALENKASSPPNNEPARSNADDNYDGDTAGWGEEAGDHDPGEGTATTQEAKDITTAHQTSAPSARPPGDSLVNSAPRPPRTVQYQLVQCPKCRVDACGLDLGEVVIIICRRCPRASRNTSKDPCPGCGRTFPVGNSNQIHEEGGGGRYFCSSCCVRYYKARRRILSSETDKPQVEKYQSLPCSKCSKGAYGLALDKAVITICPRCSKAGQNGSIDPCPGCRKSLNGIHRQRIHEEGGRGRFFCDACRQQVLNARNDPRLLEKAKESQNGAHN